MELHLALKEIVEKEGSSILTEPLLVNMLADYNAFEKCQAYKFIIKFLIENGITKDIRDLDTKQNNIDLYQNNISTKVCESFGFEKTIVSYIIVSIMYSLNLVDTIFSQKEIIRNNNERCESQANKQRHLVFKGISLNNNINTFVSLLESKGFNVISRSPNYNQVRMSGDVGYYRNCDITIFYTSISNVISTLWVHTKKNELESMRLEEFKKCIAIFKEKYGDPFYEDGKLCYFRSNGGTISLECNNILNCIEFHYFDNINSYLSNEEDKQTLLSDI